MCYNDDTFLAFNYFLAKTDETRYDCGPPEYTGTNETQRRQGQ